MLAPGELPTEPLERYFDKGVWARAKQFAQADATVDATAVIRGRDSAARANEVLKWTAIRAKRDRTLEKYRYCTCTACLQPVCLLGVVVALLPPGTPGQERGPEGAESPWLRP